MEGKKYSWLSYISIGLSVMLLILLFIMPNITYLPIARVIVFAELIGAPLTVVISVISLMKKNEKNLLAIFGLILGLVMSGGFAFFMYAMMNYSP